MKAKFILQSNLVWISWPLEGENIHPCVEMCRGTDFSHQGVKRGVSIRDRELIDPVLRGCARWYKFFRSLTLLSAMKAVQLLTIQKYNKCNSCIQKPNNIVHQFFSIDGNLNPFTFSFRGRQHNGSIMTLKERSKGITHLNSYNQMEPWQSTICAFLRDWK